MTQNLCGPLRAIFAAPKPFKVTALALACAVGSFLTTPASAEESQTYVMSRFWHAANNHEGDCPTGLNPRYKDQWAKNLVDLGIPPQEIARILEKDAEAGEGRDFESNELLKLMITRGRIDGRAVNTYAHPLAVKDPNLKPWSGKFAYGFDLDGKGVTATSFEDPESHEKGVKHELARVLGCNDEFRARLREGSASALFLWTAIKDAAPAWTFTVTGENLKKDGPVTIKVSRAMEGIKYNGNGTARADMTYRADPDPRTDHNIYKGEIKDGVISVTEPGHLFMVQEPLLFPRFTLDKFHARMKMNDQGVMEIIIGGYQPISEIYHWCGSGSIDADTNFCAEPPGIYHLLRKFADYDPDPKTGQNRAISATYYIEAVPGFLTQVKPEGLQNIPSSAHGGSR